MANLLTTAVPIRVPKAVMYVKSTAVTVSSSATLLSLFTAATDIQNHVKNLTISQPKGDIDKIDLIGETTSTNQPLQTFQNYLIEEKPYTFGKITGTLLLKPNEDPFDVMASGSGTAAVTNTYTRRQYGGSDSSKLRKVGSILLYIPISATDIRGVLLNNAVVTMGDIKATGADGHLERDFEAICSPDNYVDDFLD